MYVCICRRADETEQEIQNYMQINKKLKEKYVAIYYALNDFFCFFIKEYADIIIN